MIQIFFAAWNSSTSVANRATPSLTGLSKTTPLQSRVACLQQGETHEGSFVHAPDAWQGSRQDRAERFHGAMILAVPEASYI